MRACWIMSILTTLMSLGLLVVNTGQYQMLSILNTRNENLLKQSEKLYNEFLNEEIFKVTVENLVTRGKKVMKDLEATVVKLNSEMENKKTENDACQAEKKTEKDQLAQPEKEYTETQATVKAESDAWSQEMNTLKAQLTVNSPICDYVKKDALTQKLCDFSIATLITPPTKQ